MDGKNINSYVLKPTPMNQGKTYGLVEETAIISMSSAIKYEKKVVA